MKLYEKIFKKKQKNEEDYTECSPVLLSSSSQTNLKAVRKGPSSIPVKYVNNLSSHSTLLWYDSKKNPTSKEAIE